MAFHLPMPTDDSHYAPRYSLLNAKLGFKKVLHKHYGIDVYAGSDNISNATYPSMVFINLYSAIFSTILFPAMISMPPILRGNQTVISPVPRLAQA